MEKARHQSGENPGDWGALPLFPALETPDALDRNAKTPPFEDSFLEELADSDPVRRLRRITFLGAGEYMRHGSGREPHRRRHNRYEHSVGVAALALRYAAIRQLSVQEARVLASAGLLHDIGHGPLSHSLEPVFKSRFGLSHHEAGRKILYGESPMGNQIPRIMGRYQVDLDEVSAMIDGRHGGAHAFLYSAPVNLDTIEGITRCRLFIAATTDAPASEIVSRIARSEALPTSILDRFWKLKGEIYDIFIHDNIRLIYDGVVQSYMLKEIDNFSPSDYLLDESQFRKKHGQLFDILKVMQRLTIPQMRQHVPSALLGCEVSVPKRVFYIDHAIKLNKPSDLENRYRQFREFSTMKIDDLIGEENSP